jgi:hypothetical protein
VGIVPEGEVEGIENASINAKRKLNTLYSLIAEFVNL